MSLVKICGLNTSEAALCAAEAGADLLGFIFVKKSKRYVSPEDATKIVQEVDKWISEKKLPRATLSFPADSAEIKDSSSWFKSKSDSLLKVIKPLKGRVAPLKVGVFMNHTAEEMNKIVKEVKLDLIQLHGDEPNDIITKLCKPAIRVVHVDSNSTIESLQQNVKPGYAPFLMLDSKGGGTGKTFDWSLAAKFGKMYPFLLAGGLDPSNVEEALARVSPLGVDVCGGVEKTKGTKDLSKIKCFVKLAKDKEG